MELAAVDEPRMHLVEDLNMRRRGIVLHVLLAGVVREIQVHTSSSDLTFATRSPSTRIA